MTVGQGTMVYDEFSVFKEVVIAVAAEQQMWLGMEYGGEAVVGWILFCGIVWRQEVLDGWKTTIITSLKISQGNKNEMIIRG